MRHASSGPRVVAVLGPTNTGKTHLAMERMLGHASGMIGFPLRLLARENYDRAVAIKGSGRVALITGEEKIVPAAARYFLCTVESMPVGRRVDFLGIDEIQMCADPDRGHVFTDRLLRARGETETMFMGAETIKPLIRRLVPEAEFIVRPRFSTLAYTGERRLNRLSARTAVVAFSAADVYAIAELVRRQRGGTAVVLGALSPRTRNAQVSMYQAGEVDYLVATDAIGMGLNMDVDHVAFAATRKFDGKAVRELSAAELAQIAGRAGRHMNNGTFGTTADIGPFDADVAERIENHRFDALKTLLWRNPDLRFTSIEALRRSLGVAPERPGLVRAREADDEIALGLLAADPEIRALAIHPDAIRLLWDVCQIPDFRKVMSDAHARLLKRIYRHLMAPVGRLPADWVADHVQRLDRTDGDIETLASRIANIRTWTYVAYQVGWLADALHWQERTRAVEDRLSDALHERLTQRFVDRRTAHLVSRMKARQDLLAAVSAHGDVLVEGHFVGRLEGFRFVPDSGPDGTAAERAVTGAAHRALKGEIAARVGRLADAADDAFRFGPGAAIEWRGVPVARLVAGPTPLKPQVEALASDLLESGSRERVRRRIAVWVEGAIARGFKPLFAVRDAALAGAARGLAFQLGEALGSLPRAKAERQIAALSKSDRETLRRLGIIIGRESVFVRALLKPSAMALRARLWSVHHGVPAPLPPSGDVSVAVVKDAPRDSYEAIGYRPLGPVAVRLDMLERLAARAWALARSGPFAVDGELMALAGCTMADLGRVLAALGFKARATADGVRYHPPRRRKGSARAGRVAPASDAYSPFAKLRDLAFTS